jgi:UDP-N-acetyl-D-galactosamine dehydrogenase
MKKFDELITGKTKLAVIGLGYVGMPIAISFSEKVKTIGFDINQRKIELYKKGFDPTLEVGNEAVKNSKVQFTSNENDLKSASFFIVAVPTPVKEDTTPDLSPVVGASEVVGRNIQKGSIVVYESTVYPGVTEDICIPIIEKLSGLKCGTDWKIGYSPERINPGDKLHRLKTIKKIVSGMDQDSLEEIAKVYSLVVEAGVYKAESIKVAEAAKVIENSQRDINIAFMNELSIIFHRLGIDTKSVLAAASTKWNFLPFYPGLVGGHCIGVDPYYLTYKAQMSGYQSQVILAGRRINDGMGKYIAENAVKQLIRANKQIAKAKIGILGITFKENCPDARNSKVNDIVRELNEYGIKPIVSDPVADKNDVFNFYGITLADQKEMKNLDVLIVAVAHKQFTELSEPEIRKMFAPNGPDSKSIIIDVKGIFDKDSYEKSGYLYWRL